MSTAPPQLPARSSSRLAKRSSLDQGRTPSPSVAPPPPERTRRKLQKNPRRSASCAAPPTKHSNLSAVSQAPSTVSKAPSSPGVRSQFPTSPRAPPDLSDAKWQEYLRRSGVMDADSHATSPPATDAHDIPNLIPELAHLATQTASSRPSLDSSSTSSPASSTSTASTMRRRAKTPVHTIGQLEGESFRGDLFKGGRFTAGADLVAAQYQALLDPHDAESIHTDPHSEPPMSRAPSLDVTAYLKPQLSAGDLQFKSSGSLSAPEQDALANSPAASDGTLVGFDEEAIYFKPLSFSTEPTSPLRALKSIQDQPHQRPESIFAGHDANVGLQICTELLTRELAMAMFDKGGASSDSSALQILVMIEAYERLRDVVLGMQAQRGDLDGVETMFDTWLGALYSLYDALSGEPTRVAQTKIDCSGLPMESLD